MILETSLVIAISHEDDRAVSKFRLIETKWWYSKAEHISKHVCSETRMSILSNTVYMGFPCLNFHLKWFKSHLSARYYLILTSIIKTIGSTSWKTSLMNLKKEQLNYYSGMLDWFENWCVEFALARLLWKRSNEIIIQLTWSIMQPTWSNVIPCIPTGSMIEGEGSCRSGEIPDTDNIKETAPTVRVHSSGVVNISVVVIGHPPKRPYFIRTPLKNRVT